MIVRYDNECIDRRNLEKTGNLKTVFLGLQRIKTRVECYNIALCIFTGFERVCVYERDVQVFVYNWIFIS